MDVSPLQDELKKCDALIASLSEGTKGLLQITLHPALDLLECLKHAIHEKCFFFESKDHKKRYLGLGQSRRFDKQSASIFIDNNPEVLLFYQGKFEDTNAEGEIILPEWTLIDDGTSKKLQIAPYGETKYHPSSHFFYPDIWDSFVSPWKEYEESPEHDEWNLMMAKAQARFDDKELSKIVLSRKKIFTYDDPVDALKLFIELYKANQNSSHFSWFHQVNATTVFISFTPEKLFTVENRKLETISLAGSVPRGKTAEEEAELTRELSSSGHLTAEQDAVTEELINTLTPLCSVLTVGELRVMKLPYIIHRQRDITGTLKENLSALTLIEKMHPTPAVGGSPRLQAMEAIAEIEQSKRGFYAAPFGILSREFSEVAVGIRSAVIDNHVLTVYGGAGIVSGADPEYEWQETGTKMQPFLKVLSTGL